MVPLALFDLDNTLLSGDSDFEWGRFLADLGVVDGARHRAQNEAFYDDYRAGRLDMLAFCRFAFEPLARHPLSELLAWRQQFVQERIEPLIAPGAPALLQKHLEAGHVPVIITATNRFVTEPIAERLGVPHLLATEPEFDGQRYTGELTGVPCFQHGKVTRLQQWLEGHPDLGLADSWFYSDSHNDLPLLEQVAHPVAVDPDETLAEVARQRGWPSVSLRHDSVI